MRIEPIEPRMANELADLHLQLFPDFLLSRLGHDFLFRFYREITRGDSFGFAAVDDHGDIVGSVVCVDSVPSLWRRYFIRNPRMIIKTSLAAFSLPALRKSIFRIFTTRGERASLSVPPALLDMSPVILSVGVADAARGTGAADSLMDAAIAEWARRGVSCATVFTDAANDDAKRYYERNQFIEGARIGEGSSRPQIQYVRALTGFDPPAVRRRFVDEGLRRLCDIIAGLALLAPFAIAFPLTAVMIKRDSRGPVFFRQERVGLGGELFRILKFRTMRHNGDGYDDVTKAGLRLRRWSLDELPQFWNLLRGDMTLVGPRPDIKENVDRNPMLVHIFSRLKPGLTGLTQVSGRRELTMETRIALDALYARKRSLWLDFKLLLKTFRAVTSRRGAW